jgi:F-type H+-transporting ATPase subunit epsilon/F-type H+-transporting ATPase subunit delta
MSENFNIEIISPDNTILKQEAYQVTIPSFEGEMGILKDHIPLITFLRPGIIDIQKDNVNKRYFVEDGTVEFLKNNLLILTSTAKNLEKLDREGVEKIISQTEEKMKDNTIKDKKKFVLSHKLETLKQLR